MRRRLQEEDDITREARLRKEKRELEARQGNSVVGPVVEVLFENVVISPEDIHEEPLPKKRSRKAIRR